MKHLNIVRNSGTLQPITSLDLWYYCQSEILLMSTNSNKTKFCICKFANLSQSYESSSHISLVAMYY
jgi:hypothetical protein